MTVGQDIWRWTLFSELLLWAKEKMIDYSGSFKPGEKGKFGGAYLEEVGVEE
jgi:hypothetical protein